MTEDAIISTDQGTGRVPSAKEIRLVLQLGTPGLDRHVDVQ